MRWAVRGAILLALAAGVYFLFFHRAGTDDEQIRGLVEEGRRKFEAKDTAGFMDMISENYKDKQDFTKQSVLGILWQIFRMSDNPHAEISNVTVERTGDEALVQFDVKVRAGGGQGAPHLSLGEASARPITIRCRKEGGKMGMGAKWRVTYSTGWEDADFQGG